MRPQSLLRRFWQKIKLIFFAFLVILIVLTLLFKLNDFLSIKKIEIVSDFPIHGTDKLKNQNILFFSISENEKFLLEQNSVIKSIDIEKKFPNIISLKIEPYRPIALLKAGNGYFAIADSGKIIYKKKDLDRIYPIINYYQQFNYEETPVGSTLNFSDIALSLNLLKSSLDLGLPVETVDISGLYMIAFVMKDKKILFTTQKSEEQQKYELEKIIKQFKIEGKTFKNLDLRFDKPVISF